MMSQRATICENDLDALRAEGWTVGAYWSQPGGSGYWLTSPDETVSAEVCCTPCGDDSLSDDEGPIGPRGPCDTISEALEARIAATEEEE